MIAETRARWRAMLGHPILRLELRRIHRKRWWPGRRFFLFYPALLGAALGCGVMAALTKSLNVQLAALATGLPVVCLASAVAWLLSTALPWIAPALTAAAVARERELGTLDLLRVTLLSERSIVLGKLGGCVARLWPGILVLILLSPFQIARVATFGGGGGLLSPFYLPAVALGPSYDNAALLVAWLVLIGVAGWLRQWGNLALHATVGLFASVLCNSSGVAVAVSYGAILALRAALWLVSSLLVPMLTIALIYPMDLMASPDPSDYARFMALVPALISLAIALVEIGGAALLVWGAVWRLKRV